MAKELSLPICWRIRFIQAGRRCLVIGTWGASSYCAGTLHQHEAATFAPWRKRADGQFVDVDQVLYQPRRPVADGQALEGCRDRLVICARWRWWAGLIGKHSAAPAALVARQCSRSPAAGLGSRHGGVSVVLGVSVGVRRSADGTEDGRAGGPPLRKGGCLLPVDQGG